MCPPNFNTKVSAPAFPLEKPFGRLFINNLLDLPFLLYINEINNAMIVFQERRFLGCHWLLERRWMGEPSALSWQQRLQVVDIDGADLLGRKDRLRGL